jgi:enoyl-CoA hydratase/carnithine racemase
VPIVNVEDRDAVRHIVLNRPEKRNAMSHELLVTLAERLREAAADGGVRCVVLRGEGPVFSAGVDLGELSSQATSDSGAESLRPFRAVFLAVANLCEEMPKPVICQIHGACLGGALEVALGCDLRVVASGSKLGLPEVRLGLIPDVGGCSRLPAVVGLGRAKELIMTGRTIDAEEAGRIGLANRVVASERLDAVCAELADELLAGSAVAVGRAKRVLDAAAKPALALTLEQEVVTQELCVAALRARGAEAEEAVAAGG